MVDRQWRRKKSSPAGRLGGFSASTIVLIAVGVTSVPAAAEDGRVAPAQNAAAGAPADGQTPQSIAAPRLYVPLQPADPAQVDKQFAIGQDTAFGVQSEELIRSGHQPHDRSSSAGKGAGLRIAPTAGPEAAAK